MTKDFFTNNRDYIKNLMKRYKLSYSMAESKTSDTAVHCYYFSNSRLDISVYCLMDKHYKNQTNHRLKIKLKTGKDKGTVFEYNDSFAKYVFLQMQYGYNEQVQKSNRGIVFNEYSFEPKRR